MFGMFLIFPKLALKCALDPFAGLVDPPEKEAPAPAAPQLDEPAEGT